MKSDNNSHYLMYRVLGISDDEEGKLIDLYQNKGRFLYMYAGEFLEEAAIYCMKYKYLDATKIKIPNTLGSRPKTFEIDCLVGNKAHEIKWRDATTDGGHVTKERTRVKVINEKGYVPIRVMFYYPQRVQAQKIQAALEKLYTEIGGKYLNYMRLRIEEMKRILKSTGCIFLHCDVSASHHLRILLDDIFGTENFRSEIIWAYKRWSNSKKGLLSAHQNIFLLYQRKSL